MYNDDGDIIISEDEYLEIRKLKDFKTSYRTDFEDLRDLKSEVQYCQKLVDQCRQRLIQGNTNYMARSSRVLVISSRLCKVTFLSYVT